MTQRAGPAQRRDEQQVLALHEWQGGRIAHCRQTIQAPTTWGLAAGGRSEHTLIVHLSGRIRRLRTHIEGFGDETRPALPGDVWCVPEGYDYAAEAIGHRISFAEVTLSPRTTTGDRRVLTPRLAYRDDFLHQTVDLLLGALRAGTPHHDAIAERLQEILILHVEATYGVPEQSADPRPPRLSEKQIRAVQGYLEDHLDERVRVADLAAAAGLSLHRFRPRFAETFATTPAEYVLEQRVERARRMLRETDAEIADIAHAAGFASHSHLTETFRRRLAISPRAFRASMRGSSVPR